MSTAPDRTDKPPRGTYEIFVQITDPTGGRVCKRYRLSAQMVSDATFPILHKQTQIVGAEVADVLESPE